MNGRKLAARTFIMTLLFPVMSGWASPAHVLILRHGEKENGSSHLSKIGRKRAKALVGYFRTDPAILRLEPVQAIYAMKPKDENTGLRPVETMTPLAAALGLTIHSDYEKDELQGLVSEIRGARDDDGKTVVICWEHKRIPKIAALFGAKAAPRQWPDEVYDQVWEIDFHGDHVTGFERLHEPPIQKKSN